MQSDHLFRRVQIVVMAVLLSLVWSPASGQSASSFLLDLAGEPVAVRYSPGSLDRAVRLQDNFDLMVQGFKSWSKSKPTLVVLLLSREEWQGKGYRAPYGVPEAAGGRGIAMPAWGDDGTVQLWSRHLGTRLPTLPERPLLGTAEQAASLAVADLIAESEAARILLTVAGFAGDQVWVDGVLAHVVAWTVLQEHFASRLADVRSIFASLARTAGGDRAYSLTDAASPPSLSARLWFESQYFSAANLIAQLEGRQPARALLKQARRNGGSLTAAELVGRYPALDGWLSTAFKAE